MGGNKIILLPSYLLPGKAYFKLIRDSELVLINDIEKYQKQSPRNHFEILTSQGPIKITFPVQKPGDQTVMNEILIDRNQKWIRNHWKSIQTAYGKAPFFEFYFELFENEFRNPPDRLLELNNKLLLVCMKILKLKSPLKLISDVQNEDFLKEELADVKIDEEIIFNKPDELAYRQHFGNEFVPSMSIIDLIFNHGPESTRYLH